MFFSLISVKIVGLELFGVLQLAYLNLADNSYVNLYLSPLLDWRYLNAVSYTHLDVYKRQLNGWSGWSAATSVKCALAPSHRGSLHGAQTGAAYAARRPR